jgi:hypothetical protein
MSFAQFILPFSSFLLLHLLEHGVVALVVPELALVQVDNISAHVVQETLVVGHCTMNSNQYSHRYLLGILEG